MPKPPVSLVGSGGWRSGRPFFAKGGVGLYLHSTPDLSSRQDVLDNPDAGGVGATPATAAGACQRHILDEQAPKVTIWRGARLVQVHVPGESEAARGVRGVVKGFSSASRLRLLRMLAMVRLDALLPVFLTLTYPDVFPTDPKCWKRDLKVVLQRLSYYFPGVCGFWRVELVQRQSGTNAGEYAPHFHLVLWGIVLPRDKDKRKAVYLRFRKMWFEVVGSGDPKHLQAGTRLERIRSYKGVWWYVSKYIGKVDQSALAQRYSEGIGRWWGVLDAERLPIGEAITLELSAGEAAKLLRLIRRKLGRGGHHEFTPRFAFCDADFWLEKVIPWLKGAEPPGGYAEFCEYAGHVHAGHELINGAWYRFIPVETGGEK